MAEAGATLLLHGLPDEIILWEILVRLDPKSLLRCRAVCRGWRCATSARRFLVAHHARQPAFPIFSSDGYRNLLAFDHRAPAAAQLHAVARLDKPFILASCDGLLVLSWSDRRACLTVCNPATREHASLWRIPSDFTVVGMYPHRHTGEYKLLLQRRGCRGSNQLGCYIFALGSGQTPRYIGWPETASLKCFEAPALVRDCLQLFPFKTLFAAKKIWVFDTMVESFWQMRAPVVPPGGNLFEMDGTLGIHVHNYVTEIITIWVLQDYESEVWELKYRIKLPVADIRVQFEDNGKSWGLDVVSGR